MTVDTNTEYGTVEIKENGEVTLSKDEDLKYQMLAEKRDRDIKSLYAQLYACGFKKEKVTRTIENLCDCVHAWSVSRLDDNQISIIGKFINYYGRNL